MDDYSISSLGESRNEWVARLIDVMTPAVIEGLHSIFTEANDICKQNEEDEKYLMTFQTFLSRIPKWNADIISKERERIQKTSGCEYLEDLITCVHIIQLKALTCVRVGQKQKKIDIDVPSADSFVHKVYTLAARKLYTNVYLFEKNVAPLQQQRHARETEILIREAVMEAVRDGVPVEHILRAYMDKTEETVLTPEASSDLNSTPQSNIHVGGSSANSTEPSLASTPASTSASTPASTPASTSASTPITTASTPITTASTPITTAPTSAPTLAPTLAPTSAPTSAPTIAPTPTPTPITTTVAPTSAPTHAPTPTPITTSASTEKTSVSFTATDKAMSLDGNEITINAPKDDVTLEAKAEEGARMRAAAENDDDDDEDKISIGDEVKLEIGELVQDLNKSSNSSSSGLEEVEITPL